MDLSKHPASQDDPPPPRYIDMYNNGQNSHQAATDESHCALSESLNRLTLANAAATRLPASPSLLSPHDGPARFSPASISQPAPRRTPSSSSLRDERRKSTLGLQKRASSTSLRSLSQTNGSPSTFAGSSRGSSANFAGSPTTAAMLPQKLAVPPTPEHAGPTAATIAAEHFQKEIDLHQTVDLRSKTVVVVHDACYGHRFSRPRASRAVLGSIVERPERIRACVLGVSAAYVRLGRRHAGELFAPHPGLDIHLLPTPFQIRKTSRSLVLSDTAVTNVHGTQWMADLKAMCDVAESRLALTGKELVRPRAQGNDGLGSPGPQLHSGDLYLCSESLDAFQGALGGVCEGVDAVFGAGPTTRAFVCIRPPGHHCSADFPSGFCWINNVHVGISYAATNYGLTHAAILDFDLHHGDGSQDIAWNHNHKASTAPRNASPYRKTAIGYYSLHDINSFPCEGGDPDKVRNASVCIDGAHGQSIWNVHLETWETETEFWRLYRTKYMTLLNKARGFLRHHTKRLAGSPGGPPPKAAIFISAGFDASEWEGAGMQRHKVNVPTEFYAKFTADVVRMSQEDGLGVDGRIISVLEGGYSDRALTSGVLSHLAGFGDAAAADSMDSGLASEMMGRLGLSPTSPRDILKQPSVAVVDSHSKGLSQGPQKGPQKGPQRRESCEEGRDYYYDSEWWSPALLTELENLVTPPKQREKSAPTYFAPTRSFSAKVVAPTRDRRSTSGSHSGTDPTLPPLPDVGWATATHELSKMLIPEYRQTTSCRPEDLNAEASRQRRERQVALDGGANPAIVPTVAPPAPEDKRQLRVRKAKSPTPYSPRPATPRQQAMRKNRRTTIDVNDLPDATGESSPSVDANRRKSATAAAMDMAGSNGSTDQTTAEQAAQASSSTATGTRNTSGSRPGTPRRSASPRKAPPVPKVPAAFLPSKLADEESVSGGEVERLSAGVRKIKLVMPSPEEQAARERAASEGLRSTSSASRTPKSPGSPRKTSGAKTARSKSGAHSSLTPTSSPPPLPTPAVDPMAGDVVKQETPNNASPPITPDTIPNADTAMSQSSLFTPAMSTAQTKSGLPVFTSSSPIPFAAPEEPGQHPAQHPLPATPVHKDSESPRRDVSSS